MPASVKSSISTWKKYCPDWEIVRWDETNFDINKYTWVHEAIAQKKYAFAADFIRLYVLYNYGGVYVDTDVDFLKPIEGSLCHRFACGIQIPIVESKENIYNRNSLQTGFLYSEKHHPFLSVAMHELYDNGNRHFVKIDGSLDIMPIDIKLMDVLVGSFDANTTDKNQLLKDDIMLYNSSVYATRKSKTKDSYIVHWFDQSWTDAHGIVPKVKKFVKKYLYFVYRRQ